jgi:hypothetical protein
VTPPPSQWRRSIAQRVADAHEALWPGTLTAMVFGSTVDGIADARSDVDMSIVFEQLPAEADLAAACARAGGGAWTWRNGVLEQEGLAVGFDLEGIEVQIAYTDHRILNADLDKLLVHFEPDTAYHKVAEGLLKAAPLLGAERPLQWQARVAQVPLPLADAMMRHYLGQPTPWKWFAHLLHRDAELWCRELLVDACYRLFGTLAGLNRRHFTTFQFKRVHRFADALALAPPNLADRIEALLVAPLPTAFAQLYELEGEVLALVAAHAAHIELEAVLKRRDHWPGKP